MAILIIAVLIGLIPAAIARNKGQSFVKWWIYGALLFIIALPHALLLKTDQTAIEGRLIKEGMKRCPYCAEIVKGDAKVCRYCSRDISDTIPLVLPPRSKFRLTTVILGLIFLIILIPIGMAIIYVSTSNTDQQSYRNISGQTVIPQTVQATESLGESAAMGIENYNLRIKSKVRERALLYIDDPAFKPGIIFINFTISADGKLKKVSIDEEKTKANAFLKKIGIRSVKESSPFPPFPDYMKKDYSEMPFNVVLNFEAGE